MVIHFVVVDSIFMSLVKKLVAWTARYAAPEVLNDRCVPHQSDMYSWALVVLKMLDLPFLREGHM